MCSKNSIFFLLLPLSIWWSSLANIVAQDCFFYHKNTTEVYTTAFFAVPEDVRPGSVVAIADARIALRVILQPDIDADFVQDLLTVVIRDNSSVEIIVEKSLKGLLPIVRSLTFHLQCTGPSGAFTSLPFLITILDVNDHVPSFEKRFYETVISEFHGVGLPVTPHSLKAYDLDLPNTPNTELTYRISGGNELDYFRVVNSAEAVIVLRRKLDYETGPNHFRLNITVSDGGEPALSNWTSLVLIVADEDDQNPVFQTSVYEVSITEEIDSLKEILTVRAWDGDVGLNESLKYEITDGLHNFLHHFEIDDLSGVITLLEPVDREQIPSSAMGCISLTIQASQQSDPTRTARCTVRVAVTDINDNGPKFSKNLILREVDLLPSMFELEHLDLVQLTVFDRDAAQNAGFVSFLEADSQNRSRLSPLFRIHPQEGGSHNQTIVLRMENLSALLSHFESDVILTVVVTDANRSRRSVFSENQANEIRLDKAEVHIKFKQIWPNQLEFRSAADQYDHIPPDARPFTAQYPITLLTVFGSLICVLLLVILLMAVVYHQIKHNRLQRMRPLLFTASSSVPGKAHDLKSVRDLAVLSTESHA